MWQDGVCDGPVHAQPGGELWILSTSNYSLSQFGNYFFPLVPMLVPMLAPVLPLRSATLPSNGARDAAVPLVPTFVT